MSLVRLWDCDAHLLPGRLRLHLPHLLRNPSLARRIEQRLSRMPGVQSIRANPDTGRLLLLFDHAHVKLESLRCHLEIRHPIPASFPSRREALAQALIPGAALTVVAAKRWVLGPSALSQSWGTYDVAGLVTAVASYPFLRRGLTGVLQRRRVNGDLLIGIAGLCMAFLRENLLGLTALFLTGLNNLFLSTAMEASWSASGGSVDQGESGAATVLMERSAKLAARWGAIAIGAAVVVGVSTLNWRRALASLIAAAPVAPAISASLPLSTAVVRARHQGMTVSGTDAIAAAGMVDSPMNDNALTSLGRQATKTIKQNVLLLTSLNAAGLALAISGAITPLGASLWHNLTALAVQFNAMRLLRCEDTRFRSASPCP